MRKGPSGFVGGLASGVGGLMATPFVAAFGSAAILTSSIDATTHMFDAVQIDSRCRPRRNFGEWGTVTERLEVDFMKAIGIRIHTLKFTAIDKKNIARGKNKKKIIIRGCGRKYKLKGKRPETSSREFSGEVHYTVGFNETIVLRASDLQLYNELKVEVWDKNMTKQHPIALTFLKVSELMLELGQFKSKRMNKLKESLSCAVFTTEDVGQADLARSRSNSVQYLKRMRNVSQRNLNVQLGKGAKGSDGEGGGGAAKGSERRASITSNWKEDDVLYSKVTSILPVMNEVVVYVPGKKANKIVEMMKDTKNMVGVVGKGIGDGFGALGNKVKRSDSSDSDDFGNLGGRGKLGGGGWIGAGEDEFKEDDLGESGQVYGKLMMSYFTVEF